MRPSLLLALALLLGPMASARPLAAQYSDRKALEAALDALPPEGRKLYISPLLGQTKIRGNALILEEDQERLVERYHATLERPEKLIECRDRMKPETCTMPEGAVLYQFLLPEPVGKDRILALRVVRLISEKGSGGTIHRENWIMALARRQGLGWDVIKKQLEGEAEGPWSVPGG